MLCLHSISAPPSARAIVLRTRTAKDHSTPGLVASQSSTLQEPKINRLLEFVQTDVEFRSDTSFHLPHWLRDTTIARSAVTR
jgi:hypothetical protein